MRYVRNLVQNNVRVGQSSRTTGELVGVYLEPENVVTEVDPKTKERTYRPGENVSNVEDDVFMSPKFNRSLGVLIEEISEEEYRARLEVLHAYHAGKDERKQTLTGPTGQELTVVQDKGPEKAVATATILEDGTVKVVESSEFSGGDLVTVGRPDPARGGKTLTELRSEGVRKDENAPGVPVPQDVLNQMGQGN